MMILLTKFELILISGFSAYARKLLNQSEHEQKLIRPGDGHNVCIHLIWDQSCERFVRKCMETTKCDSQMDRQKNE